MKRCEFTFDLPEELIAQNPSKVRGEDRLLVMGRESGELKDCMMGDIVDLVDEGTLMVFNNSRVRKSRVWGKREGAQKESQFLFLSSMENARKWRVLLSNARKFKAGSRIYFPEGYEALVSKSAEDEGKESRTLEFDKELSEDWFERNAHVPLPPYIKREDTKSDEERYQTVYSSVLGSAACPTAGLHFTQGMLAALKAKGVEMTFLTLHVGLGTFLPVREEKIEAHKMHEEVFSVSEESAKAVNDAKREGRKVLAVGTTSVRTLESFCDEEGSLKSGSGKTSIFIYPPYKFKIVDELLTNFHTPESTLLMLVSAFAGKENILAAYRHAVEARYKFFSYGDAMLIKN